MADDLLSAASACVRPHAACESRHVTAALLLSQFCIRLPVDGLLYFVRLQVLPAVIPRARAVSYKPRWVLLLEFQLILPVSIDVAYVKSGGVELPD